MADAQTDPTPTKTALREALRRARGDAAERSAVVIELRTAELNRLDVLKERLEPLFSDLPVSIDLFDLGVTRGDPARLFIDVVAFIELGHDRRSYHFYNDTRYGRVKLAESDSLDVMVEAVTDYVARRLVERERALAADTLNIAMPPQRTAPAIEQAARVERSAKGLAAAVFAAFALGTVAGVGALLSFAWLWTSGQGLAF